MYLYLIKTIFCSVEDIHCMIFITADDDDTKHDAKHVIEVLIIYSNGNAKTFTWKGPKSSSSQRKICRHYDALVGLDYVQAVWIRQRGSKNTWFARNILVQDNPGSSSYVQYGLNPPTFEFWTDG